MANQQTECLNKKCSKPVSDGNLWCSMECKKQFLLDDFSDGQCHMWFEEADKDFRERQKRVMAEIKASGLGVRDFLLTMGKFKDVPLEEETPVEKKIVDDFCLSDKIDYASCEKTKVKNANYLGWGDECVRIDHIREFIKELKEKFVFEGINTSHIQGIINKLAGEKLI